MVVDAVSLKSTLRVYGHVLPGMQEESLTTIHRRHRE